MISAFGDHQELWQAGQPNCQLPALRRHERSAAKSERPVLRSARDAEFTEFVGARMTAVRRVAYLLCQDWHPADDLVQVAITKLYANWHRASGMDHTEAYVRTILVREYMSERRSGWARAREFTFGDLPGRMLDSIDENGNGGACVGLVQLGLAGGDRHLGAAAAAPNAMSCGVTDKWYRAGCDETASEARPPLVPAGPPIFPSGLP
jgi:Sigma-70 region 2